MNKTLLTCVIPLLLIALPAATAQAKDAKQDKPAVQNKPYTYKTVGELDLVMDVYFPPEHDPAKAKVPGLILFHGGGWSSGSRKQFDFACEYFASRGLVCATVQYRMHGKNGVPKKPEDGASRKQVCVVDAKSAIRWFKQHAEELGIDPQRIIAGGGSAGGHISALATMNQDINDPSDDLQIDTRVAAYLWFNPAFSDGDKFNPEMTVLENMKAQQPPSIAFFGDEDTWIKGWNVVHAKWKSMGTKTVELWLAPGQQHAFFNKEPWRSITLIAADDFLVRQGLLQGKATLPQPEGGEPLVQQK